MDYVKIDEEVPVEVRTALSNAMGAILIGINAYKAYDKAKKEAEVLANEGPVIVEEL